MFVIKGGSVDGLACEMVIHAPALISFVAYPYTNLVDDGVADLAHQDHQPGSRGVCWGVWRKCLV